jgi:hypothetical protein
VICHTSILKSICIIPFSGGEVEGEENESEITILEESPQKLNRKS